MDPADSDVVAVVFDGTFGEITQETYTVSYCKTKCGLQISSLIAMHSGGRSHRFKIDL